jgi:DNA-binding response OmpR family regulator
MERFSERSLAMKNILILGNERAPESGLHRLLSGSGYSVTAGRVSHGAASLRVNETPVDLVIIDEEVPGQSDNECLRCVKLAAPRVPVIVLSVRASVENYLQALSLGAFEYLNKPVADREIVRVVKAAAKTSGQGRLFAA